MLLPEAHRKRIKQKLRTPALMHRISRSSWCAASRPWAWPNRRGTAPRWSAARPPLSLSTAIRTTSKPWFIIIDGSPASGSVVTLVFCRDRSAIHDGGDRIAAFEVGVHHGNRQVCGIADTPRNCHCWLRRIDIWGLQKYNLSWDRPPHLRQITPLGGSEDRDRGLWSNRLALIRRFRKDAETTASLCGIEK